MTQFTSIKVGLLVMFVATVPWSLAQRPRSATSGSNQTGVITPALAGHSGLSGNSTSGAQLGTNFRSSMSTGLNTNVGAHIGINAQTGISNPTGGIIGGAAGGLSVSSGNPTSAAQTGINAVSGTNTGVNTNVGARIGINAGAQTGINQTGGGPPGLAGSSGNSTGAAQTGANTRAGTITCSRVCWPISFSGISRCGWKKKAPALTVSQVRRLLAVVLPLKVFQADEVLQLVAGMQLRHHRAYLSHRKRRLHEICD